MNIDINKRIYILAEVYKPNQLLQVMKNKTLAAFLAFFLGGFGIHRFYLGQGGLGLLYLLFFWTSIPFFVSFVDFVLLLVMDEQSFDYKYNPAHYSFNVQRNMAMSMNASTTPPQNNVQSKSISPSKEIQRLYELKQMGAITETEYEIQKARLLNIPYTPPTPNPPQMPNEFSQNPLPPQQQPPQIGLSPEDAW